MKRPGRGPLLRSRSRAVGGPRDRSPRRSTPASWTVGVDTGGTFVDAIAVSSDGTTRVAKVLATPDDPTEAVSKAFAALQRLGVSPGRVRLVVHGTTIATNALLEGRLARPVLVTTAGFSDVIAIGTGMRPDVYDLWAVRPDPIVAPEDRLEARERIDCLGRVVVALDDLECDRVAAEAQARQPGSVAVACLFSYVDDTHERRLAEAIRRALPDVPVVHSSEVAREFREYPRATTTVLAAALKPSTGRYLQRLERELPTTGRRPPVLVMLSNGGTAPPARAAETPHRLLLSGPAGGVAAAIGIGQRLGVEDLISLDVGGTSADVCLVSDGVAPTTTQLVNGRPILTPAIDIVTVGAGGGSIATVDGDRLRIGPESAGAVPGPAAYGRGGTQPTVTDAHVVVGELGQGRLLAGRLPVDGARAHEAVALLADALALGVEDAAAAILAVARAELGRAVRRVSMERGRDPRGMAMVAFGGAGPLHAAVILRELGLGEVIVPPHPGLGSAAGLLAADVRVDASQTLLARLDRADPGRLAAWFREAATSLAAELRGGPAGGRRPRYVASADCRYVGQGFELNVPVAGMTRRAVRKLADDFRDLHLRTYGHAGPTDEPVEVVTVRLSAFGGVPRDDQLRERHAAVRRPPPRVANLGERLVRLPGRSRPTKVRIWRRDLLVAGSELTGPGLVEEDDSTTLVLPGMIARVGAWGELRIRSAV